MISGMRLDGVHSCAHKVHTSYSMYLLYDRVVQIERIASPAESFIGLVVSALSCMSSAARTGAPQRID